MEKFWTFVSNMTFWNWLALIAFLFVPLSALNAFFSLRSRFRDWRATRSKVRFDKRLAELRDKLKAVVFFRTHTTELTLYVLEKTLHALTRGFVCLLICISGFLVSSLFSSQGSIRNSIGLVTVIAAGWLIADTLGGLSVVLELVKNSNVPADLVHHVLAFVADGKSKGYLSSEDNEVKDYLQANNLLN